MRIYTVAAPAPGVLLEAEPCAEDELIFCATGTGSFYVGGRELPVRAGDVVAVPAGTVRSKMETPGALLVFPSVEGPLTRFGVYRDDGQFVSLFNMAQKALSHKGEYWTVYGYGLCNTMMRLLHCLGASSTTEAPLMVQQLRERINAGATDPAFDLAAEIEKTGYCAGYVRQIFRQTYGSPPRSYLNQQRVGYSKMLLRAFGRSVSIKEISLRSGFRDPYYYSRVFRQFEGISPSEYIDSLNQAGD